jgi:protein TonB
MGLHGAAVLALVLSVTKAPRVERVKLPGSPQGKHLLLSYSLGGQESAKVSALPKKLTGTKVKVPVPTTTAPPVEAATAKTQAEQGSGSSGLSALGSGNVTIAAVKVFPRPRPDLSSLAHGAGGNVVMDAQIDAKGAITQLTLMQGLGEAIDTQVMATVRGWSFVPATRDGTPVASEQEIVLHYERG